MPVGGAPAATDLADGMGFTDDTTIPTDHVRAWGHGCACSRIGRIPVRHHSLPKCET
jgi:hypothetical protein